MVQAKIKLYEPKIPKLTSGFGSLNSKKRKTISKSLRLQVWEKYMKNKIEGKCYCCKIRTIHYTDFQVGHNKAVAKGGNNHISNLRPICGLCNRGMKTKSIEAYRKKHFSKPKLKIAPKRTSKKIIKKKPSKKKPRDAFQNLLRKLPQ
ncbi:MAG: HNH endonuclease signature motif containing protein [archaeon]